jgi:hypothetical protein
LRTFSTRPSASPWEISMFRGLASVPKIRFG